jgi:hypothetical protein
MIRVVTLTALIAISGAAMAEKLNFDADAVGKPPTGWTVAKTGTGDPRWTVEEDAPAGPKVVGSRAGRPIRSCSRTERR